MTRTPPRIKIAPIINLKVSGSLKTKVEITAVKSGNVNIKRAATVGLSLDSPALKRSSPKTSQKSV